MASGSSKLNNAIAFIEPLQNRVLLSAVITAEVDAFPPENWDPYDENGPDSYAIVITCNDDATKVEVNKKDDRVSGLEVKINGVKDLTIDAIAGVNKANITRIIVIGGDGNDELKVNDGIKNPGYGLAQPTFMTAEIYGNGGNDKIRGGSGDDILVGGAGDDAISGKDGRDLAIGGTGSDTLLGDKKDDIIIAGFTDYDGDPGRGLPLNRPALNSILGEWAGYTTVNLEADMRVQNITEGVNYYPDASYEEPVGIAQLTTAASSIIYSGGIPTVWDDGIYDELTGGSGADWFMFNAGQDKVKDYKTTKDAALQGDLDTFSDPYDNPYTIGVP